MGKTLEINDYIVWFVANIFFHRNSDEDLSNFITGHFNSIEPKEHRTIKTVEWLYGLNYFHELDKRVNQFEKTLIIQHYFAKFNLGDGYNIYEEICSKSQLVIEKAIRIIQSISKNDDIINSKGENGVKKISYTDKSEILKIKINDDYREFTSLPKWKQNQIIDLYHEFEDEYQIQQELFDWDIDHQLHEQFNDETDEMIFLSIRTLAIESLLNTRINDWCKQYIRENVSSEPGDHLGNQFERFFRLATDSDRIKNADEFFYSEVNRKVTAYFIHYVLRILGVKTSTDSSPNGITLIDRSKTNAFVKLICALTTKDAEKLNVISNTYYKAVNNLFRYSEDYKAEKDLVINDLKTVRDLLEKYGLTNAVDLVNEDLSIISSSR